MKNGNIKTIFFDAADTLFYIERGLGNTYASVAKKYGGDPHPDHLRKAFSKAFKSAPPLAFGGVSDDERKVLEKSYWKDIVENVYEEIGMFKEFDAHFDELFEVFRSEAWAIFPETKDVLKTLKKNNYNLGIISNFDSRVYDVMKNLEIHEYFETFVISSEAGYAKPNPNIFHLALKEMKADPNECLHIGDHIHNDFHGARALGIKALLLDRNGHYESIGDQHRISALKEIHKFLDNS
ncbi:MAG: HAD-IA family hydrolase [Candidatus Dadabacteria bacterium]|nr:HAD-IA family hydrolase [Candidatus Dadabacteria bacterium]